MLHPALAGLIAPLRTLLRGLAALRREGSAVANLLDSGPDLLLRTDADADSAADRARLVAFARAQDLPRIAWARGGEPPETILPAAPAARRCCPASRSRRRPAPSCKPRAEGEAAIVAAVLAGLPARLPPRARDRRAVRRGAAP